MGVSLETGSVFADKYRIDGVLGRGGMGTVFAATNVAVGRRVAVKVMDVGNADDEQRAQLFDRFQLEAQAASLIDHPGLVDVIDMGETELGEPFIVMEFLEGATLKEVQKRLGKLTVGQVVAVLDPVLDALSAAHQAHVVHRDIKPANLFLCTRPKQVVKVLDFGISRFGAGSGLTVTGAAMGTPQYMAPEQVRGEKNVGPEADLYSVGAVIYSLMSGRPPFDSDNDMAVLARVLTETHVPLGQVVADVPAELSTLVDLLLAKDAARRPSSAAQVRATLDAIAEADPDGLWAAAKSAVRQELAKGTPRPGSSGLGSRPGVLALPGSGSRSGVATKAKQAALEAPPPARATPLGLIIAGLLLVVAGAAGAYLAFSNSEPVREVPPVPVESPSTAPSKPTTVTITLSAEPPEARFTVDEQSQVGNPCTVVADAGAILTVQVSAESYLRTEFEVECDQSHTRHVTLAPEPKKGGQPPPTKKPKPLSVDESNPYK